MAFIREKWFLILVLGTGLFFGADLALRSTGNPNYFPTVIMLGSTLVPVTFVTFTYERLRHNEIPLGWIMVSFLVGGVIGLIVAGILEYQALQTLGIFQLFGIGLIEETAKLIVPLYIYYLAVYRHEADGLLFGVASGMGFAALETMGYGMVALFESSGDVAFLEQLLFLRGLLSPAVHAAWTGLVCAVIWLERERGRGLGSPRVIAAFGAAVILHTLWNLLTDADGVVGAAGSLAIALTGLGLLLGRMSQSRRDNPV
jgi:RsiW-degrading membrane proteinase PrsW (M82 family)